MSSYIVRYVCILYACIPFILYYHTTLTKQVVTTDLFAKNMLSIISTYATLQRSDLFICLPDKRVLQQRDTGTKRSSYFENNVDANPGGVTSRSLSVAQQQSPRESFGITCHYLAASKGLELCSVPYRGCCSWFPCEGVLPKSSVGVIVVVTSALKTPISHRKTGLF